MFDKPDGEFARNEIGRQELIYTLPPTRFDIINGDVLTQTFEHRDTKVIKKEKIVSINHQFTPQLFSQTLLSIINICLTKAGGTHRIIRTDEGEKQYVAT